MLLTISVKDNKKGVLVPSSEVCDYTQMKKLNILILSAASHRHFNPETTVQGSLPVT